LNGSLEPEEQARLRGHLEGCSACQAELRETRRAAAVFGAHLASRAIVDLAWDRPPSGIDTETARRHLETCASCADELTDARESRSAEANAANVRPAAAAPAFWKQAPLAAGLVLGLVAGVFWGSGRRPVDTGGEERQRLASRLAEVDAEATRLRDRQAELQRRLERLEAPQANVPVVEVQPDGAIQRSGGQRPKEVVLPAGTPFVTLVLDSTASAKGPVAVEIRGADGALLWRVSGLHPSEPGGYTLALPVERLPDGTVTLLISGGDGAGRPESYTLLVRKR
jgi:hypothetical protein